MIDYYFLAAVKEYLADLFPTTFIGLQTDAEPITFPAITLEIRSESQAGPLYRGTMTATVLSQADDTALSAHGEMVAEVGEALDAMTLTSDVFVLAGLCSTVSDTQRAERHWQSSLQYTVGFSAS